MGDEQTTNGLEALAPVVSTLSINGVDYKIGGVKCGDITNANRHIREQRYDAFMSSVKPHQLPNDAIGDIFAKIAMAPLTMFTPFFDPDGIPRIIWYATIRGGDNKRFEAITGLDMNAIDRLLAVTMELSRMFDKGKGDVPLDSGVAKP